MNDMTPDAFETPEEERKEGGPIVVSDDLLAFLKDEYGRCEDGALEEERATAIKRYNGEAYGDEENGRSQVVARDTAKTTDYMVASILRTVVSGDRVVEFAHKNKQLAQEATETIHWLLLDKQNGFRMLHDWLKAGLLEKNAVAMTFMETMPPKRRVYNGVSEQALALALEKGAQIIEGEQAGEGRFNVALALKRDPEFPDYAVPNEEFYCSPDARTIDEALLKGRRMLRHISDLVAEGYDADELANLGDEGALSDQLSTARDDGRYNSQGARKEGSRQVWWHEEFARFDANGDGIAELLYIRRTSDFTIYDIDEMEEPDDHPFVDWCPFPMPHRRIGQSLADKVMPYERVNTVLLRQTLDGIYLSNRPRTFLHEGSIGETTIEDLLNPQVGAVIRWRGNIKPETGQDYFNAAEGFKALEYVAGQVEELTGITRLNQGLDAETLNKTATGTALLQNQGQQMEEYIARQFGDALANLFTKKARLLKKYGKALTVPIDGEFKQIDPSKWPEDMIARPRIGLGASRKEKRVQSLMGVMGMQRELVAGGMTNLVTPANLFASAKAFVAETGLGEANEFFTDPMVVNPQTGKKELPPQQPKPDPEMAKVQAQVQMEQQKAQAQQQMDAFKLQAQQQADAAKFEAQQQIEAAKAELERQKATAKLMIDREIAAAKLEMDRERAQFEADMAAAKSQAEIDLAYAKMDAEIELQRERMAHDLTAKMADIDAKANLRDDRAGGDLDK